MTPLALLDQARRVTPDSARRRAMRASGEALHAELAGGPHVIAVRTLPLSTSFASSALAFGGAALSPAPYVVLTHRATLVQLFEGGAPKTILFQPTAPPIETEPPLRGLLPRRPFPSLEAQLFALGLSPSDVEHLPLAPAGMLQDRSLGDGALLIETAGATRDHSTLFLSTAQGVWGVTSTGVAADSWSPLASGIPGLARHARSRDVDVITNAPTPDARAEQYAAMTLEKTIASRLRRAPAFVQLFPASEVTPSVFAPGLRPTIVHRELSFGSVIPGRSRGADTPRGPYGAMDRTREAHALP